VLLPVLLVVFLAGALAGAVAVSRVFAARRAVAIADHEAAVSAAVGAVLAERQATARAVIEDRERMVQHAVDAVIKVAGTELECRLKTGSERVDLRAESFEQRVQDISGELRRVTDQVATMQQERAQQHGEVVSRLEQTTAAAAALQQTAQGLREVLASPKSRGQWGERMADDVLRAVGFVEGVNYRRQSVTDTGKRPDFTFLLPDGLELNMDVKFPLDNYVRFLDSVTDTDRDAARVAFVRDVRNRVREITGREYIDPARTVDHVLLFIPNESVYTFIHESDSELLDKALAQHVVLCSPSTLFSVLAVVRQAMRNFVFERTSDEILRSLVRFNKQWGKFAEQLDKVGKHLGTLASSYDELAGTRRRQLEKELERIESLQSRCDTDTNVDQPASVDELAPTEEWSSVRALRAG
jgi:DNA recombination protein RmuC